MFYGISTLVGNLMPNPLSLSYIYFFKKKTTKPITKDYKFISILLRIFEIFKNTKKN